MLRRERSKLLVKKRSDSAAAITNLEPMESRLLLAAAPVATLALFNTANARNVAVMIVANYKGASAANPIIVSGSYFLNRFGNGTFSHLPTTSKPSSDTNQPNTSPSNNSANQQDGTTASPDLPEARMTKSGPTSFATSHIQSANSKEEVISPPVNSSVSGLLTTYSDSSSNRPSFAPSSLYAAALGTSVTIRAFASIPQKLAANLAKVALDSAEHQIIPAMAAQFPIVSQIPRLYHLRWPMLNQIDSIGQFVEESALSFRQTVSTTHLSRAGTITIGILAADMILIGYCCRDCFFNPSRKRQRANPFDNSDSPILEPAQA